MFIGFMSLVRYIRVKFPFPLLRPEDHGILVRKILEMKRGIEEMEREGQVFRAIWSHPSSFVFGTGRGAL